MTKTNIFVSASIWSMLSEVVAKLISPISFVILTKILSPDDFGIVAIASTILSYLYIVADLGISKVLIQTDIQNRKDFKRTLNAGFYFNITLGALLFILLFFSSEFIADKMGVISASPVIKALSIQVVFFSLSSVHTAIRKKEMHFKFLFKVRMITTIIPSVVSIYFAFNGLGYWAIVLGQIIGSFFSTITFWFFSDWKPTLDVKWINLKNVLSKSVWSSLEQIIILIPVGLDSYLLSNFIGVYALGIYSTCRSLFSSAITISLGAITPVLFSRLSNVKNNLKQFNLELISSQKIVFSLALTMGIGVYLFANEIETLIFNEKWKGIHLYIKIIFVLMSLEYFTSAISEGLRAKGYFKSLATNTFIATLFTVPLLFQFVDSGLMTYIIVRSLCLFLYYPLVFYYSKKMLKINWTVYINNNLYGFLVFILIIALDYYIHDSYISINTRLLSKIGLFLGFITFMFFYNLNVVKKLILKK